MRNFTLFLQNLVTTCVSRLLAKRGLTTKIHAVCVSERFVLKFQLSAGNRHDAPEGRKLIESLGFKAGCHLLMDCAYEEDKTRALVLEQGLIPVIPPKKDRKTPWVYDAVLYKRRNEIERFFLRLRRFCRVFTRYDKLDIIYSSVLTLALIFDALFMWTGSR